MALERFIVVVLVVIVAWVVIRYIITPTVIWLISPYVAIAKSKHSRLVAESRLRIASEDANVVRVEAQIESIERDVISELVNGKKRDRDE